MNVPEPWNNWNDLITAVLREDTPATEAFAKEIGRAAYSFFLGLVDSPTEAEDIAVSCTTLLVTKLDKFDGRHFSAWAHTVFRHYLAEQRRNKPSLVGVDDIGLLEAPMYGGRDAWMNPAARGAVATALSQLDEKDQKIIALRFGREPLAFKKIAIEVGLPDGNTRVRFNRALKKLKQLLRADPRLKDRIARCEEAANVQLTRTRTTERAL